MSIWSMFLQYSGNYRKLRIALKVMMHHRELDSVERTCDKWLSRLPPEADRSRWLNIKQNAHMTRTRVNEFAREELELR